jgi:dTDP-4-amino-4,6-dideoxygalactose transaminase
MRVPFTDLAGVNAPLQGELMEAFADVVRDNAFVLGPAVGKFEADFASYLGRRYCVAVSSGTAALHLALLVAGVAAGDEVITTPLSWISTTWAITYCGARPVFVDVEPGTGNLNPNLVEERVNDHTRALLPVDLYGNPSRLDLLAEVATARNLRLVDDACQAHGSRFQRRPVGAMGDLACFSFYPGKNLGGVGEGGAIVTDDPDLDSRMRELRDHAQSGRHNHVCIGFNYRMDGLQGAALAIKLVHLDQWNQERRRVAARYLAELDDAGVDLPEVTPDADPNWHLFVVHVNERDRFRARLADLGIESGVHYPLPIHLQPAYGSLGYEEGDFPVAERLAASCLSLPISPVMTEAQQDAVIDAVTSVAKELR